MRADSSEPTEILIFTLTKAVVAYYYSYKGKTTEQIVFGFAATWTLLGTLKGQ